jgi:hypothetical protein
VQDKYLIQKQKLKRKKISEMLPEELAKIKEKEKK